MTRILFLTMLLFLILTNFSAEAAKYPCVLRLDECLKSNKPLETCSCGLLIDPGWFKKEKVVIVYNLEKNDVNGVCSASNIRFPNKAYDHPYCDSDE